MVYLVDPKDPMVFKCTTLCPTLCLGYHPCQVKPLYGIPPIPI